MTTPNPGVVPTKERLARDLEAAGLPDMAAKARQGYYDDFESDLAMPEHQLHDDLLARGRDDMAADVRRGKWDATKEEAQAWMRREGVAYLQGKR